MKVKLTDVQDYIIRAFADSGNIVDESDKTNNSKEISVTVHEEPKPDLSIDTIVMSPSSPTTADSIKLSITVKNVGTNSSATSVLSIKTGENIPQKLNVAALDPGESATVLLKEKLTTVQICTVTVYSGTVYATGSANCSIKTIHEGEILYSAVTGIGSVRIDGVESVADTFTIPNDGTKDITISHFGTQKTFKGTISHIRVYGK